MSAGRWAALPFTLRRSRDVFDQESITSTTETVFGLLRLTDDRLVVQWRLTRQTDTMGMEIRSDEEMEPVREVVVPLERVAGAWVRKRWWSRRPEIVVTAADLRAFEELTGEGGLRSSHPAELVLKLRRSDRIAAEEFGAELSLAVAELAAGVRDEDRMTLSPGEPRDGPAAGSPVGQRSHRARGEERRG